MYFIAYIGYLLIRYKKDKQAKAVVAKPAAYKVLSE